MKRFFMSLCVLTLFGMMGCGSSTEDGADTARPASDGGGSTERTAEEDPTAADEPKVGEAEHTFSLSVPFESVALTQGEEVSVRIGINRGTNFGEEVEIEVSELPKGVTVDSDEPTIEQGNTGVDLTFKATGDAALGDFTAKVTGRTESSTADFTEEIKLTVSQE